MKQLLILFSLILVGAISTSTPADAHSKKRTKYGTVQCMDYTSRQISLSYCNAHTDALGSQPARPRKRCSVSHSHTTSSSSSGGYMYVDTTGDGIADTLAVEAEAGTAYQGSNTQGAEVDTENTVTVRHSDDLILDGTHTIVSGTVDDGFNDHEYEGESLGEAIGDFISGD